MAIQTPCVVPMFLSHLCRACPGKAQFQGSSPVRRTSPLKSCRPPTQVRRGWSARFASTLKPVRSESGWCIPQRPLHLLEYWFAAPTAPMIFTAVMTQSPTKCYFPGSRCPFPISSTSGPAPLLPRVGRTLLTSGLQTAVPPRHSPFAPAFGHRRIELRSPCRCAQH